MTKIKICGITRKEDALLCLELGAWAVGFIFVPDTPRYISPKEAAVIINTLESEGENSKIAKVGVFLDESLEEIVRVSRIAKITKIQLHGEESPEFCASVKKETGLEIIKAFRVKNSIVPISTIEIEKIKSYRETASLILLDSFSEKAAGGTGEAFDWGIAVEIKKILDKAGIPLILAGGIDARNLQMALKTVSPFAVDVSSGVESEMSKKGVKDRQKIVKLFSTAKLS